MKKINRIFFAGMVAIAVIGFKPLKAQDPGVVDVKMDEEVNESIFSRKHGPNGKHYAYIFWRLSAAVPIQNDQPLKVPASLNYRWGGMYKFRVCNFYALTAELSASTSEYILKNTNVLQPYHLLAQWEHERIVVGAFTGVISNRFNFGKRGNHLGRYLDLGVYGDLYARRSHIFLGEDDKVAIEARREKPDYMNSQSWGFQVGIGVKKIRIVGQYRMSDLLKPGKVNGGDLPRLMLGLELGV